MSETKKPSEWAAAKSLDPATLAGAAIFHKWDRNPGLVLDEATFDDGVRAFEGLSFGGTHIPDPPKAAEAKAKKASPDEVK